MLLKQKLFALLFTLFFTFASVTGAMVVGELNARLIQNPDLVISCSGVNSVRNTSCNIERQSMVIKCGANHNCNNQRPARRLKPPLTVREFVNEFGYQVDPNKVAQNPFRNHPPNSAALNEINSYLARRQVSVQEAEALLLHKLPYQVDPNRRGYNITIDRPNDLSALYIISMVDEFGSKWYKVGICFLNGMSPEEAISARLKDEPVTPGTPKLHYYLVGRRHIMVEMEQRILDNQHGFLIYRDYPSARDIENLFVRTELFREKVKILGPNGKMQTSTFDLDVFIQNIVNDYAYLQYLTSDGYVYFNQNQNVMIMDEFVWAFVKPWEQIPWKKLKGLVDQEALITYYNLNLYGNAYDGRIYPPDFIRR